MEIKVRFIHWLTNNFSNSFWNHIKIRVFFLIIEQTLIIISFYVWSSFFIDRCTCFTKLFVHIIFCSERKTMINRPLMDMYKYYPPFLKKFTAEQ